MALGHGDGLSVDILNACKLHTEWSYPQAQGHGNGHGGEHVISIQFACNGRVAHGAPARHLHQLHIEAIAVVEAHRLGHDDRRSAGDWNESHLQRRLLKITHLHRGITAGLFALGPTVGQGDQGGTRGKTLQERAPAERVGCPHIAEKPPSLRPKGGRKSLIQPTRFIR